MTYKNPILNFADKHPIAAFFVVPIGMQLIGRAVAMTIRTVKYGEPLSAIMPSLNDSSNELRNLGYTGGQTADADMIQSRPEGAPVRYDPMYHESGFLTDPNYQSRDATMAPSQVHESTTIVGKSPNSNPNGLTLAGSRHSVFNGLSGAHKLNY